MMTKIFSILDKIWWIITTIIYIGILVVTAIPLFIKELLVTNTKKLIDNRPAKIIRPR